ncbi:sperm-associated antigen 5 [Heptranchias perlo]|uniref:sperm-associated antigen 5 n=1 Tax=Heptranchias perlo TaxID=212740 RepID=UPI0035597AF6
MFSARRSAASSSSENEGEELQTLIGKCARVPLQEVLPQCSAQRELKNSISKRPSLTLLGSTLTPLIRRLHLQEDGQQVPPLVYEDLCQKIFVEDQFIGTSQGSGLTPLVRHAVPRVGACRDRRPLVAAAPEHGARGVIPESSRTEGEDSDSAGARAAITSPVHKGEQATTEAWKDPVPSIGNGIVISGCPLEQRRSPPPPGTEAVAEETVADPGDTLPASPENAGGLGGFRGLCPGAAADSSLDVAPESGGSEGQGLVAVSCGSVACLLSSEAIGEPERTVEEACGAPECLPTGEGVPGTGEGVLVSEDGHSGAGVEVGTSPMLAQQPCALMCIVHSSLRTPGPAEAVAAWRQLVGEVGRSRIISREVGTVITPMGTHCAGTCVTPVSLAEKEVNTSVSEGGQSEVVDSAVLTDSLLWNFSREDLESLPRGDLERRLETALLINEVLSGQLSDLSKSKGLGLRAGPADQREAVTQTNSTQALEVDDQYRSLYLQQFSRVRDLELSLDQYQKLHNMICQTREQQNSLVEEVEESLASADGAYEEMKRERARMHEQNQEMRKLLKSNMEVLSTMRERTRRAFEQREEMRKRTETVLRDKEAVQQCCNELSANSAERIRQLELDLGTWQQMCESLYHARVEQSALNEEFEMVAKSAVITYEEMAANHQKIHLQLKEARDLACQSTSHLQTMTQRTASALKQETALRREVDEAKWKEANMQQELEQTACRLHDALDKVKRLTCENLQLKSGLTTLTAQLTEVEEERNKLMKDNSRYFVEVATTEASLKLTEAALAQRTERLQACEAQNKELVGTLRENIQSLEETLDKLKQEKEGVDLAVAESRAQVTHLTRMLKQKDEKLQELSDTQAQAALTADNNEFLEQELVMSREQLMETEVQLSEQVHLLHDRNLQCEELRTQCDSFQVSLDTVKKDAREMLLEMGEQMNQAMVEISALNGQIHEVTNSAECTLKKWQQNRPGAGVGARTDQLAPVSQTKEEVQDTDQSIEENQEGAPCDIRSEHSAFAPINPTTPKRAERDEGASLDLGSCRGAFARVEPVTTKKTEVEDTLLLRIAKLREDLRKLLDVQSLSENAMQLQAQDQQQEISKVREQRKTMFSKHWLELNTLQDKVRDLETENRRLNRDLQTQIKTKSELEKAVTSQDETILEFSKRMEANFKEHTVFLATQEEATDLKRKLQRAETEAHTFLGELNKLQGSGGALDMNWLQEKVELQQHVRKLRDADVQRENDVQELKVKMNRHRVILEQNNQKAEAELAKLDNLIEHVRIVLLSVPDVVANSAELKSLLHDLGDDVGE